MRSALAFRTACRLLLAAVALPCLIVVLLALRGETDPIGRALLAIVAALFAAVAIAVWFRHTPAIYVQIIALPMLAAVYLFELRRTDPVDRMLHVEELWRLVKAKRAQACR